MRVDLVTIFPQFFDVLDVSLLGKAREHGRLHVEVHDLRRWATGPHRAVDDIPYGGGPGMVMRPEPWWAALTELTAGVEDTRPRVVVPTPSGRPFTQGLAQELAAQPWLVLCCGRYEGIDERVVEHWATDLVSIGDYVVAGGESASLVILEAVSRLLPGVVGNAASVADDSFSAGLLEGPVYTRPPLWQGREVPEVLRSGDHAAVARWRREQSLRRTAERRPDLLAHAALTQADRAVIGDAAPGVGQ